METNHLAKFLNVLVTVFLVLMVITFLTLPYLIDQYMAFAGALTSGTLLLKLFLYVTAIPFFVLLVMVKKCCKNVLQHEAFSMSSIKSLHVISICAFLDALLYTIGTFVILRNLLSLTLMIAAFMIGLVSLLIAQLMKMAVNIKEENDLTI